LEDLKLYTLCKRRYPLMHCSLFKFTFVLNFVPFWKLSISEFLLIISDFVQCLLFK
jgi:hypothetical protein